MSDAPVLAVNFADPDVLQDPYPWFDAIRAAGPVVYNPSTDTWMVTGYDHIREVLLNDQIYVPEAERFEAMYGAPVVESMEDPRHAEVRTVYGPTFRAGNLRELRATAADIIIPRLEDVARRLDLGEVVDVVPHVARESAGMVLASVLGVSEEDVPRFLAWAHEMGATLESYDETDPERAAQLRHTGTEAMRLTFEFAGDQLDERSGRPETNDLISHFAHSPVAAKMSAAERQAAITQVIVAGHDNITHTLGHVFVALAMYPEQRAEIDADRSLIPRAIEELLRWRTSASADTRLVRGATELQGVKLHDGARVLLLHAAANRDPSRWENPDEFDISRPPQAHLSFGSGIHTCMGAGLARMEAQLMMEEILDRVPPFRLADEVVEYGPPLFMRGPKAIRIVQ